MKVLFADGEKSAVAARRWLTGYQVEVTNGAYRWLGNPERLAHLQGKSVEICFGAYIDPVANENVGKAKETLAQSLADIGCQVSIVELPIKGGLDMRLDEFLEIYKAKAFMELPRVAPTLQPGLNL